MLVCSLCTKHARARGWTPEADHEEAGETALGHPQQPATTATPGEYGPGGHDSQLNRDVEEANAAAGANDSRPTHGLSPYGQLDGSGASDRTRIERALGVFNESPHRGMIVGIARTLGTPWASATSASDGPGDVAIAVVWELSWYEFRVDLDARAVALVRRGDKLDELDSALKGWNLEVSSQGRLSTDAGSSDRGEETD